MLEEGYLYFRSQKLEEVGLAGPLGQLDNLDVTANVYVVSVERGEEDKLKLPVRAGVVDDVLQGNLSIHGVHEHVELVQHPERRSHSIPKSQYERHARVRLL